MPSGVVTVTLIVPCERAGAVAVICVALSTVKLVAGVPPKLTAVAPVRLVPVMITGVPPVVTPLVGLRPVTAGVAAFTITEVVEPTEFSVVVRLLPAASRSVPPFSLRLPTVMPSASRSPAWTAYLNTTALVVDPDK